MTTKYGKQIVPTFTVTPYRIILFQATQRPVYKVALTTETSWGRCKVTGRIGQRHADIVEAILFVAEKKRTVCGELELLVDPAKVRKLLSDAGYSHARLWSNLREIMSAVIELEPKDKRFRAMGHIIESVIESPATRPDPLTGGQRHLWRVKVGDALLALMQHDLHLMYDPTPITRLKNGISQAAARHILSHKSEPNGGWKLDSIIQFVVGEEPLSSVSLRHRRREIRSDADGLAVVGITIDNDRLHHSPKACSTGPTKLIK